jgi:hypothetical protein
MPTHRTSYVTEIITNNASNFGDMANGHYSEFESDGSYVMHGNATVWEDLLPSSVTIGTTGPNFPAFTVYNGNLCAYEFVGSGNVTKEIHLGFQMQHGWKLGSNISPHLHLYIANTALGGTVKFYCEYTWTNINETGTIATQTINGTIVRTNAQSTANNALLAFSEINGTGKGLSSMLMCRIYRTTTDDADTYESSVWLKSADLHIEKDTDGSREPLVK